MNKKRWLSLGSGGLLVILAMIGGLARQQQAKGSLTLTAAEANQLVLEQYTGEIERNTLENGAYRIRLRTGTGVYELAVDARESGISSIVRLEAAASPMLVADQVRDMGGPQSVTAEAGSDFPYKQNIVTEQRSGEVALSPTTPSASPTIQLITKDEAKALSLKQVVGKVDKVKLLESNGSFSYLVEIETIKGKEAEVQVHAVSGAILSVTWDDADED